MDPLTWLLILSGVSIISGGTQYFAQNSMLDKQQDFNSAEAEKARDWSSESSRFDRMTQLGFNPDLAAASIMGNVQSVPYAASSPNAPQVPGLFDQLMKMVGSMPGMDIDAQKAPLEIEGLQLDNLTKRIQNDFLPFQLSEQINMWKAYAEEAGSQSLLNMANLPVVQAYARYAEPIAAEQYFQAMALTDKMFLECDKIFADTQAQWAEIDLKSVVKRWYGKDIQLKDSEIMKNKAEELYFYNSSYERETAANLNIAQEGLVRAKTDTEEKLAMKTLQDAISQYISNQKVADFHLKADTLNDLVMMDFAERGEGRNVRDVILDGERTIYDNMIQSRWQNYHKEFMMNLGDAVPEFIRGFIPISHYSIPSKSKMPSSSSSSSGSKSIAPGSTMGGSWKATWPASGTVHEFKTTPEGKIYKDY